MYTVLVRVPESNARELLSNPAEADRLLEDKVYPSLDIDKAWHVLHFALTGEVWEGEGPGAFLLLGGELVGEDAGYGPARLFMPDEVEEIAKTVSELTVADVEKVKTFEAAGELYGGWDGPISDEEFRYLTHHLAALQSFVAESRGSALLVAMR